MDLLFDFLVALPFAARGSFCWIVPLLSSSSAFFAAFKDREH